MPLTESGLINTSLQTKTVSRLQIWTLAWLDRGCGVISTRCHWCPHPTVISSNVMGSQRVIAPLRIGTSKGRRFVTCIFTQPTRHCIHVQDQLARQLIPPS